MSIDTSRITSPVHIDLVWDELTDKQRFSLWVVASGSHFLSATTQESRDWTIERYKEVLA